MDRQVEAFLRGDGLSEERVQPDVLLDAFRREMDAGLAGRPSSLKMIPAFVSIDNPLPVERPVVVLDAGGTNLRAAVIRFDARGRAVFAHAVRGRMPGTGAPVSADVFFDALAAFVEPLAGAAPEIGFCFSYPAEITPDCDARLLHWTKGVQAPEVIGRMVGAELASRLAALGHRVRVTVLNDTVAALLAGKSLGLSRRYGSHVGFILGTGTNTAYVEQNAAIHKRRDLDPDGVMAINVESGGFSGAPRSRFDERFDATTVDPGSYAFEKMISGAYLGGLGLTVLKVAAEDGLFSTPVAAALGGWTTLTNKDLDDFCDHPFTAGGPFAALPLTDGDRRVARECGVAVYRRAARLAAVNIVAAVLKTGSGHDPLHPVCVNIDGSTYYRTLTADFRSRVQGHVRDLLEPRAVSCELVGMDDAPMVGAAVAGLTRD